MHKRMFSLGVLVLSMVLLGTIVYALPVDITEVKIDNDVLKEGSSNKLDMERGQEVEVKIRLMANADLDNVQVEAVMRGHDHPQDLVEDITDTFRVKNGTEYIKRLKLTIPSRMEQDTFKLRVRVEDRNGESTVKNYDLVISAKRHDVSIRDIILNPENEVRAGRTLLVALRLKNTGQKDEEGVKVRVSIPELGISASDFVNEIEAEDQDNDQATSNELFLRIPADAETGVYTLKAEAYFRDLDDVVTKEANVRVIAEEAEQPVTTTTGGKKEDKTIIFVPTNSQALVAGGAELFYPVTITNMGSESKAYIVTVDNVNWGTVRVAPSNVAVIDAGQSATLNVYVSAATSAPAGEQLFLVNIKTGDKVLQQIPLKAVISKPAAAPGGTFKLRTVLEVLAVVLLVLVIIILLVFGMSRIMKKDEEEGEESETYY